jgi:hypothetical protein
MVVAWSKNCAAVSTITWHVKQLLREKKNNRRHPENENDDENKQRPTPY